MRITILGAGAFGTAVSVALCKLGKEVELWSRNGRVISSLSSSARENSVYLRGFRLPDEVTVQHDIQQALKSPDVVLLCVPAQELRGLCGTIKAAGGISIDVPLLICSKGIESASLKFVSEIVEEFLPQNPALILSGPALAKEIACGLPCSMLLAGRDLNTAKLLSSQLSGPALSIGYSDDLIGIQVSAALKNVIAIACGIVLGRNLGCNAASTVMVQGIKEIEAVCVAKSGKVDMNTITGIACLGDLVLTCTTPSSRNMSFGMSVGQNPEVATRTGSALVEGVESARAVRKLGKELGIELPVCSAVAQLVDGELNIGSAIQQILSHSIA